VAEKLKGVRLEFPARAGETGKLYGSITTQMIADNLSEILGTEITKRQIASQPLRLLGLHKVKVRLTIDLIPAFDVVVYREGESPENYMIDAEDLEAEEFEEYEEVEEVVVEVDSSETPFEETSEQQDPEETE
jgi:large subunit ribosomal protein L9